MVVGFKSDVLTVCCGGRGRYHYNMSVARGDEAATTCKDPSTRLLWEGVHRPLCSAGGKPDWFQLVQQCSVKRISRKKPKTENPN